MAAKIKVSQSQYETLASFRYSLRQFLRFSEEQAHAAGVAPQQYQAMLAIRGFPGGGRMTMSELAERLQIRHHSAVGLVDRLASRGLVQRKSAPADRRQVHVCLTARGEQLLEGLSAAHQEQLRRVGPEIESLLRRLRGGNATSK